MLSWIWTLPPAMHVAVFALEGVALAAFFKVLVLYWQRLTRAIWIFLGDLFSLSLAEFGRTLDLYTLVVLVFSAAFWTSVRNGQKHDNLLKEPAEWSRAKLQRFIFGASSLITAFVVLFFLSQFREAGQVLLRSHVITLAFISSIIFTAVICFMQFIFLYSRARVAPIMRDKDGGIRKRFVLAIAVPGHLLMVGFVIAILLFVGTAAFPRYITAAVAAGAFPDLLVSCGGIVFFVVRLVQF